MIDIEMKSDELIMNALKLGATDIHIVPTDGNSIIQFRIMDQLYYKEMLPNHLAEKLISHYKFRSKMDIGERRKPQNGALFVVVNSQKVHLRMSTLPTLPHESLAIRVFPQQKQFELPTMMMFPKQIEKLRKMMKRKHGLLLISGPTGAGKSTTIYSLLLEASKYGKRIISIEDPVEIKTNSFIQVEINEKAGLTYEQALKSSLRHDPDLIMIGEIRDDHTAKMAVRAAMTGHLVVSTIHANSAGGCITRLRELGIKQHDIKETVVGLIAQRLLNVRCAHCNGYDLNCKNKDKHRRLSIFEIISEEKLHFVLNSEEKASADEIKKMLIKSFALGFIDKSEFERWF